MLSYTDLLRVSYADAVDDDADNVESIVLICLPYDKWNSSHFADKHHKEQPQFYQNEFHALPVCEGELLVGIVTTTDVIKYFLEQYDGVK
jgi:CBS domain-containing protein